MIEIDLRNYNEMIRYEPVMDRLRALALWISERGPDIPKSISAQGSWQEDLFLLIKHFSKEFALDIEEHGSVTDSAVSRFSSAIVTVEKNLGITDEDIKNARQRQLYLGSGFWEMRRFLGQFADIAEELSPNPPDHFIAAGISGCIVAEYLALKLENVYGIKADVVHMVFARDVAQPVKGILPGNFEPKGTKILLIEDAVEESRTLTVMIETLLNLDPNLEFDLFALAIDYNEVTKAALRKVSRIFTFDE